MDMETKLTEMLNAVKGTKTLQEVQDAIWMHGEPFEGDDELIAQASRNDTIKEICGELIAVIYGEKWKLQLIEGMATEMLREWQNAKTIEEVEAEIEARGEWMDGDDSNREDAAQAEIKKEIANKLIAVINGYEGSN